MLLPIDPSYRAVPLTQEQAMDKMLRNSVKAIVEHSLKPGYASDPEKAVPSMEVLQQKEIASLKLSYTFAKDIGPRAEMEDAHFFEEIEQGHLVAVLDGHRGREVADYACAEFKKRFSAVLKEHEGDAFRAFEVLLHQIHLEVALKREWDKIGSTAVISFIDKETHQIITATLGDSEANLYREHQSIPLSPIRDWTSRKDSGRLEKAMNWAEGMIKDMVKQGDNPKIFRWKGNGVNVSRALGDFASTGTPETPGVIHKPKITINKLQKGDILILACDGLKDYVEEDEIVEMAMETNAKTFSNIVKWSVNWFIKNICFGDPKTGLAAELVHHAVHYRDSEDNVTVVVVEVS